MKKQQDTLRLIPVTPGVIAKSCRANSGHCMIAEAIKEAMPQMSAVSVDLQTIRFSDRKKGVRYIYLTPESAQRQLLRFDYGVVVEPWTLRLPARPNQIVKIKQSDPKRHVAGSNVLGRPKKTGPPKVTEDSGVVTIVGGEPPPLAVLGHSPHGGPGHRGIMRQFGLRVTGDNYNPNV